MQEENTDRQISRMFRPNSSLPQDNNYDFEAYLTILQDNLKGPLRQFRSKMLDVGNLMYVDQDQRRVYRDMVFEAERQMMGLMDGWMDFYHLEEAKEAIRGYEDNHS